MSEQTTTPDAPVSGERADILSILGFQRWLLYSAVDGITDEQARQRSTVSELTLGGLVKHLTDTEHSWMNFIEHGPDGMGGKPFDQMGPEDWAARENSFRLLEGETLADALQAHREVSERTDALVRTVDLDLAHPLPVAPWFPPGETRTARRVFLGMVGELSQHTGHADIIREAIDGKKSMG